MKMTNDDAQKTIDNVAIDLQFAAFYFSSELPGLGVNALEPKIGFTDAMLGPKQDMMVYTVLGGALNSGFEALAFFGHPEKTYEELGRLGLADRAQRIAVMKVGVFRYLENLEGVTKKRREVYSEAANLQLGAFNYMIERARIEDHYFDRNLSKVENLQSEKLHPITVREYATCDTGYHTCERGYNLLFTQLRGLEIKNIGCNELLKMLAE
jgi:hypothetical protein